MGLSSRDPVVRGFTAEPFRSKEGSDRDRKLSAVEGLPQEAEESLGQEDDDQGEDEADGD